MLYRSSLPSTTLSWIATLALLFTLTGCDSTDANEEPDIGEGSFTVSGDVERDASGNALFSTFESDTANTLTIDITDNQNFSLTFQRFYDSDTDPLSAFSEGTYELVEPTVAGSPFNDLSMYGEYEEFDEGELFGVTYTSKEDLPGTLEVTSVSENEIRGTFSFQAVDFDNENAGVSVSEGEFQATANP